MIRSAAIAALSLGLAGPARSITIHPVDLSDVEQLHGGNIEHCDEAVAENDFLEAFECGDELFEAAFNAADGVGANVGDGGRFTRAPRADLTGPGQWASHTPSRATGPNAASCVSCHVGAEFGGGGDGSGPAELNAVRDPLMTALPGQFIQRNTPHLFGLGGLQRLAEEMTLELLAQRDSGIEQACASSTTLDVPLMAKGVDFGSIIVDCTGVLDIGNLAGVDQDLSVRPFQWKGVEATVRSFVRGAGHNELGMQAVELVGEGVDGDGDGVANELTIPDVTAMAVYLGGQPRPVTELELNALRARLAKLGGAKLADELSLPSLSSNEVGAILRGQETFLATGCADCHRPTLTIQQPVFSEPSTVSGYRDDPFFPAGQPPLVDTFSFDLTRDLPDNHVELKGQHFDLGNFERDASGAAIVRLFGDLKRHDMGAELAENIDETGHGASVWMTKELWGVGSTSQFLHDGRATTLHEAILEHGGEGAVSRSVYAALGEQDKADLLRFLENLVLYFPDPPAAVAQIPKPTPKAKHGGKSKPSRQRRR